MRELVLVLPDLFLAATAGRSTPVAPQAALSLLRWSTPRLMRGGWRAMLARGVAREDLALVDEASVVDAALRLPAGEIEDAWLATPLHLMPGLKTLHFPANGLLRLNAAEAAELASEFAAVFGRDGLALAPAGSAGFVLRGFPAPGVLAVDPARLIGAALEDCLPSGAGSADLRALASEIEMWLHELPLNRKREIRGEPRISSLWLWGGGQPPRDPICASEAGRDHARWRLLASDDAWVHALAQLAGLRTCSLHDLSVNDLTDGEVDTACVVAPLAESDAQSFDERYIAPAVRALGEGRLGALVLAANDRWVAVTAADRYKFWRMRRSFVAAVADSGA